jgi:hypothetical protein
MTTKIICWLTCTAFAGLHVFFHTGEATPWLAAGFVILAMWDSK